MKRGRWPRVKVVRPAGEYQICIPITYIYIFLLTYRDCNVYMLHRAASVTYVQNERDAIPRRFVMTATLRGWRRVVRRFLFASRSKYRSINLPTCNSQ